MTGFSERVSHQQLVSHRTYLALFLFFWIFTRKNSLTLVTQQRHRYSRLSHGQPFLLLTLEVDIVTFILATFTSNFSALRAWRHFSFDLGFYGRLELTPNILLRFLCTLQHLFLWLLIFAVHAVGLASVNEVWLDSLQFNRPFLFLDHSHGLRSVRFPLHHKRISVRSQITVFRNWLCNLLVLPAIVGLKLSELRDSQRISQTIDPPLLGVAFFIWWDILHLFGPTTLLDCFVDLQIFRWSPLYIFIHIHRYFITPSLRLLMPSNILLAHLFGKRVVQLEKVLLWLLRLVNFVLLVIALQILLQRLILLKSVVYHFDIWVESCDTLVRDLWNDILSVFLQCHGIW